MKIRRTAKTWFGILRDPQHAFEKLATRSLESVLTEYLVLLLLVAVAAGAYILIENFVKGFFFSSFLGVDVSYIQLTNYAFGGVTAAVFFYMFAGTFIMFFISMCLRPFYKLKYVDLLRAAMYALTPTLLFGWIIPITLATLLWSAILFVNGTKVLHHAKQRQKGTIRER